MLFKKRRRERLLKMISNKKPNNNTEVDEESEDEVVNKNVRDIPGFYFDYKMNRYFPIKNTHTKTFSEYIKQKNEKTIMNEMHKKKGIREVKDIPSISIYKLISSAFKIDKKDLVSNPNLIQIRTERIKKDLKIIELKKKAFLTKYDMLRFNNIDYLVSLENTENKNNLYIERIIKGDIL